MSHVCRSCGQTNLSTILSLGKTPLANALMTETQLTQFEETYPLNLVFCPICTLVQITETVPPEKLFRQYVYFSSFADTAVQNAKALVEQLIISRELTQQSLAIEIASNDGYLLQHYHHQNIPVLGIEPALNIAQVAQQRGIRTISEFFGQELAQQLRQKGQLADVIHANNVLAHVADLNGFVEGISLLLKNNGMAVIEVPYIKDLIDHVEFDTIYHEHLCYFSLTALNKLFTKHGLSVVDVEHITIHGGTLRLFIQKNPASQSLNVQSLLAKELSWGVDKLAFYQNFGGKVAQLRESLVALLHDLKTQGKQIAVYGASAKGSTLLNYFGLGQETLDFVVDRSTVKQGLYTPGSHLRIYSPEKLLEAKPDYTLLLSWNFAEEILNQQHEYHQRGGRFIIPIPELKIV